MLKVFRVIIQVATAILEVLPIIEKFIPKKDERSTSQDGNSSDVKVLE